MSTNTREIEILDARTLEDAMDKAVDRAESYRWNGDNCKVIKITFKTVECEPIFYGRPHFTYIFLAEFEKEN